MFKAAGSRAEILSDLVSGLDAFWEEIQLPVISISYPSLGLFKQAPPTAVNGYFEYRTESTGVPKNRD